MKHLRDVPYLTERSTDAYYDGQNQYLREVYVEYATAREVYTREIVILRKWNGAASRMMEHRPRKRR